MNKKRVVTMVSIGFLSLALLITTIADAKKMDIKIILGSARQGRSSDKVGNAVKAVIDQRTDVTCEILDLRDYHLPFLEDATPPSVREKITDPAIQKWSNIISHSDAFILIVPVYNMGYPGVLKNALDVLYKEWNNKPVAFVGYSGSGTGGATVIEQLRDVAHELKMIPVEATITIPQAWKSFDAQRNLVYKSMNHDVNRIVDQLIAAKK